MELVRKYFPDLTKLQYEQLEALGPLYTDWNNKINVISRKDIDNLYEHHVLHSLAIAKVIRFTQGTRIADVGTGGGFPGIPLAILFPECSFTLIDSIGKKVRVAQDVAAKIGLKNVIGRHERAEEDKDKYEFILSRGVMPLPDLCSVAGRMIDRKIQRNAYPNGIICLKGGDLSVETAKFRKTTDITEISKFFTEEFFKDKKTVYVQI
ncbi:MAG: 16S rRNA (guanine(527)-N(7))-methyltransferase RsmG [Bacteroidaceae bacterium]|nr:16S rRNA (guanine(527)-N(7))-methyltransferase RsmG [Bacteroidaceae bacterium]